MGRPASGHKLVVVLLAKKNPGNAPAQRPVRTDQRDSSFGDRFVISFLAMTSRPGSPHCPHVTAGHSNPAFCAGLAGMGAGKSGFFQDAAFPAFLPFARRALPQIPPKVRHPDQQIYRKKDQSKNEPKEPEVLLRNVTAPVEDSARTACLRCQGRADT